MSPDSDDITIFAINYFNKKAEEKGISLREYVEKLESDIRNIMGVTSNDDC